MFKWRVMFYMKNGDTFEGYYQGSESESGKVAKKLITGDQNSFTGLYGENDKHNLFVKLGEIQACDISEY